MEREPSRLWRGMWAVWRLWYDAWCWLLAWLCAPAWAFSSARRVRAARDYFAEARALQEAAYRHMAETFLRLEDAEAERRTLELASPAASASADAALSAFYQRLVGYDAASNQEAAAD